MLSFDGVHLLLPKEDVVTIETSASVDWRGRVDGALGTLQTDAGESPVYALDGAFRARAECPPIYRLCVVIGREDEIAFSLACEEVGEVSLANDCRPVALQECMRLPGSPIESLLLQDGRLLLIGGVDAMQRFLNPGIAA